MRGGLKINESASKQVTHKIWLPLVLALEVKDRALEALTAKHSYQHHSCVGQRAPSMAAVPNPSPH